MKLSNFAKSLLMIIITAMVIMVLTNCTEEPVLTRSITPEEEETLVGNWQGVNWYCNNVSSCVVNPVDVSAVLSFSVDVVNDTVMLSSGTWTKPSCVPPSCGTNKWIVTSVKYSNDELTIEWKHGYTFKGIKQGQKFLGTVTYTYSAGSYIWNNNVELIKKE